MSMLKYYITGSFIIAYWYIPFIILPFLASPLHILFCRLDLKDKLLLVFILSLITLKLHRPIDNFNILHSFLYFTPIYLFGIAVSTHYSSLHIFFRKRIVLLDFLFFYGFYTNPYWRVWKLS